MNYLPAAFAFTQPSSPTPAACVQWDVVEEHLDECAYQLELWGRALVSPDYVLREVRCGPEQAWLRQLRGCLIAGEAALQRQILPLLEEPDEAPTDVLAVAALTARIWGRHEELIQALGAAGERSTDALLNGLRLGSAPAFDRHVVEGFRRCRDGGERVLWLRLAAARNLTLPNVAHSLGSSSLAEAQLALQILAWTHDEHTQCLRSVEELVNEAPAPLRLAAIRTGLRWGSMRAFAACRIWAARSVPCPPLVLESLALFGDQGDHQLLLHCLQNQGNRAHAIRALGYTGDTQHMELLLNMLRVQSNLEVQLAGEAMHLIAGLDLRDEQLQRTDPADDPAALGLPDFDADDLDAALEPTPPATLPLLDAEAAATWWSGAAARFSPKERYLCGEPSSPAALVKQLAVGTMRNRHALAWMLAVRSGGKHVVHADALTERQYAELNALSHGSLTDHTVAFSRW